MKGLCWSPVLLLMLASLLQAMDFPDESKTMDDVLMELNNFQSDDKSPRGLRHTRSADLPEGHVMSGLDMALTPEQHRILHETGAPTSRTSLPEGTILSVPWPNGEIPYYIDTADFHPEQLAWIHRAMDDWMNMTCVRFRRAASSDKHKVHIRKGTGCWAHLGMIEQFPQIVNLQMDNGVGCFWKGLIHHELGHTIGLIHEHQRQQRDAYIRVDYYQVLSNQIDAVTKYALGADTKLGLPYDYTSVMHYGKTAFSSGFYRQTIYPRQTNMTDVIGFTLGPSFMDAKLVNMMYQCKNKCSRPPSCSSDCFVNEHCQCICQKDWPQEVCQDLVSDCAHRAASGGCINHYGMMHHSCRKTCGICKDDGSVPHLLCVNGDGDDTCAQRVAAGKCQSDANNMQYNCRKACGLCKTPEMLPQPGPCVDKNSTCAALADKGECERDAPNMLRDCTKSCKFCPENVGQDPTTSATGCHDYDPGMCYYRADNNICLKHYTLMAVKCPKACNRCNFTMPSNCSDSNTQCPKWAFSDECENNPGYMEKSCKMSCDTCANLNKPDFGCVDYNKQCKEWQDRKECFANPNWMSKNCQKTCRECPGDPPLAMPCEDFDDRCGDWQKRGECQNNPVWMAIHCRLACGRCQAGTVDHNDGPCHDGHLSCEYWSLIGECDRNPGFMHRMCNKSCQICSPDGSHATRPTHNPHVSTSRQPPTANCRDDNDNCKSWADNQQCHDNPGYMLTHCKYSCGSCDTPCVDENKYCPDWAAHGHCASNPGYMLKHCKKSCRVC